jgi:hypothetical protein
MLCKQKTPQNGMRVTRNSRHREDGESEGQCRAIMLPGPLSSFNVSKQLWPRPLAGVTLIHRCRWPVWHLPLTKLMRWLGGEKLLNLTSARRRLRQEPKEKAAWPIPQRTTGHPWSSLSQQCTCHNSSRASVLMIRRAINQAHPRCELFACITLKFTQIH